MNTRSKTTFIILGTFLLGLIAGALVNRSLTQYRIRRILSQRRPTAFINFYERILEPTPEQATEIKKILDHHASENSKLRQDFFDATQKSLSALLEELEPLLTEEQRKRLSDALEHPPWGGPGPPPNSMFMGPDQEAMRLKEMLNLTPEQTEQLSAVLEKPGSMPKRLPTRPARFDDKRNIFHKHWEERNRDIMKILTDEQKTVFQTYLDQRRNRRPPWEAPPEKP